MEELNRQQTMPALALRGLTVFPQMLLHFDVGRQASIQALDESMASGQPIFLVAQRELAVESPQEKDLYSIGTICNVRQILRLPGDNVRVMVEGVSRGRLCLLPKTTPYLNALVEELPAEQPVRRSARTEALIRQTYELFERFIELAPKMTPDVLLSVLSSEDPGYIADYIAQNLPMRTGDKQAILEELRPVRRLERLCQSLRREVEILELEQEMQGKVREQLTRSQRDYVLREQLKVLQQELGEEGAGGDSEIAEYRQRIAKAKLPQEVADKLTKEVGRLEKQPFGSAEATVLRNYLDTVLELPWGKHTKERVNVEAARRVLDVDHYGLEKVKERILEFLAVKQLAPGLKGQILCLVGPPGVGKTSIAMSMARALNRKLARISLGGVHDEAEIRGHRKTYVGAMPGRIIAAVKQAESCNPLLLLDEIDKLGNDQRGDPASALLEVLDAEQNSTFRDHFLEVPFDLSDVLFITTANTLDTIPRPLLDRMEDINSSGERAFLYGITMENHQPFDPEKFNYECQIGVTSESLGEEDMAIVRVMLEGITRADQALGDLTDALRESEEPTIVVFFGDHRPNLFMTDGDTVYTKLGLCPDNDTVGWTPEEISDLYSTDYLIWANDAALLQGQAGTRRDSSITAIGPQLLELTGQPVTRYWALLEKVSQVCLTNTELYFVDGTGTPSAGVEEAALSDEARELLQLREDVLYDAMYGQQYITAEMNEPVQ